jgi:hypothetical protein
MLVTASDSKTASALPFENIAMQAVRKATLKTLFALPYQDLLVGTKGDAVKVVKALRARLVREPIDAKVLNVWVDGPDRIRGVDVKRLQTIVNDSKVGTVPPFALSSSKPKAR